MAKHYAKYREILVPEHEEVPEGISWVLAKDRTRSKVDFKL